VKVKTEPKIEKPKAELVEVGEQVVKATKGRGGNSNFPNSKKDIVQNNEDRELVRKLLIEVLEEYKKPKVKSDEELAKRLSDYFSKCAKTGQTPTVEEMAMCTGYTQSTVWDWEVGRNKGFSPQTSEIIKKAKEFLKTFDAKLVVAGKLNFLAYCFRAKNYYGLVDKQEYVLTPNNPLGEITDSQEIRQRIQAAVVEDE